jgi:hypothetical protein
MKDKLGILFLHHNINDVVLNNLSSIRRHNPEATIVTISAGQKLPHGYSIDTTPEVKSFFLKNPRRSSDWLVCSWFSQRVEQCDKWWIIEWDTYSRISVESYYHCVWDFPFVASSVRLRHREPGWPWFNATKGMPKDLVPFAMGAVPFLYLVSAGALENICSALLKAPFYAGNGELRFATIANKCGFAPCGYSPPDDQITWKSLTSIKNKKYIFHPVKYFVDDSDTDLPKT